MHLPADFLSISQSHLEALIAACEEEGPHLEFKRDVPQTWGNGEKHELAADASAFANAGGGDLIFGIDEDSQGRASALVPQALCDADQAAIRIQDILLSQTEPRLPGTRIRAIPVSVGGVNGHVVVVRILPSWQAPHRVKTNQHFFVRDGMKKRQLEVPEIRNLFLRTEGQAQRVRDFRADRVGKILSGSLPMRMAEGALLVVHLVPTESARGEVSIDPVPFTHTHVPVLASSARYARINLDGALATAEDRERKCEGYSQIFRNGFFESVEVLTRRNDIGKLQLPSLRYERAVAKLLDSYRAILSGLRVGSEISVMLSILNAQEVQLGVSQDLFDFSDEQQTFFDRPIVLIPDVTTQPETSAFQALKPVFDLVWQAAGFVGSANYDAAGAWRPAT
jgi:Putative DNA-binding domain